MLRGLTGAGLGATANDEQLIELAASNGFHTVDLDALGLVNKLGVDQARELLSSKGLKIGSIGLSIDWRSTDASFRAGLGRLTEEASAAAALGCTSCCTYVLPSVDASSAHFMAQATKRLRVSAQILGVFGIRLGLEFVGPHHLRTAWLNPFIWTMQETLDWIDAIGEPNVGLLLDSYHWYTTNGTITDLEQLRPDQIVHVHINDAPDVPVEQVIDNERLYPGEGVIDLSGFLQALHKIGYTGSIAQEILTKVAPDGTPEELAAKSGRAFDKVYASAGL